MNMKTFFLLLLFFALCLPVFSQEDSQLYLLTDEILTDEISTDDETSSDVDLTDENLAENLPPLDAVFIINSFVFNIKGFTRPYAIVYHGELKKGEELNGFPALEKYIADKTQLLMNERVLEKVTIEYTIGEATEYGKYPVDLFLDIKDTWNIIALPYPKYSSNSGFEFYVKARDYNFLGTMSPLRLDIGYIYDEEGKSSFKLALDANIPFTLFDLYWNVKFYNAFDYRPEVEQPIFYMNTTGLSVELPVKFTTVTVGFNESVLYNQENSDVEKLISGEDFQEGVYMSSSPYVSWEIPTGLEVGKWGELVYTPGISASFNHEFSNWPLQEIRKGPFLTFNHVLGFEQVDWIGNFRRGFDVFADNSFTFDFYKLSEDKAFSSNIVLSGIGHFIITDFFGISTNVMYRHWFFYDYGYTEAGDVMRGIIDKSVAEKNDEIIGVELMLSLNLDFPVRVLRFVPSQWLNKSKLRIFNFDLHVSPILDTAFYRDLDGENAFLASGGMEFIVFPEFFRSLHLRISFGWDLINRDIREFEIFVGTDFHY